MQHHCKQYHKLPKSLYQTNHSFFMIFYLTSVPVEVWSDFFGHSVRNIFVALRLVESQLICTRHRTNLHMQWPGKHQTHAHTLLRQMRFVGYGSPKNTPGAFPPQTHKPLRFIARNIFNQATATSPRPDSLS